MTEMTPEMLRAVPHDSHCQSLILNRPPGIIWPCNCHSQAVDAAASAWEADLTESSLKNERIAAYEVTLRTAEAHIEALEEEVATDDRLLAERDRLLDAIPECGAHGKRCIPHAIEWVQAALATGENLMDAPPGVRGDCIAAEENLMDTEMTPEYADMRVVREGFCYLCETDLNEGHGHTDCCPWPEIRAAWAAAHETLHRLGGEDAAEEKKP